VFYRAQNYKELGFKDAPKGVDMIKAGAVTALIGLLLVCGCGGPSNEKRESVTVKGSDTMLPLVTPWAEEYMAANPGVDVSVTGGGSGTGIAALINGTTDLCAASREISVEEKKKAEAKGIKPRETTVARDGIAIVVHPSNPVNELSTEQLRKIYIGATTAWKDLGGADAAIVPYSRESSSGTYVFFQEHVMNKADYAVNVRLMPATSAIIQAVEADANAIGYVGLGHAYEAGNKVKIVAVRIEDGKPAVAASEKAVLDGSYPISRALYFYCPEPAPQAAGKFIEYCLSQRGQNTARRVGFVPVK
jgi:phosphate transport system substrate-binding protein